MEGFKKVFPDNVDKDYFFYRKNIKHPFFKGLHIIVDLIDKVITVYCKDVQSNYDVLIFKSKYSESKLNDVEKWLEK